MALVCCDNNLSELRSNHSEKLILFGVKAKLHIAAGQQLCRSP
jgi:hypothetical protein